MALAPTWAAAVDARVPRDGSTRSQARVDQPWQRPLTPEMTDSAAGAVELSPLTGGPPGAPWTRVGRPGPWRAARTGRRRTDGAPGPPPSAASPGGADGQTEDGRSPRAPRPQLRHRPRPAWPDAHPSEERRRRPKRRAHPGPGTGAARVSDRSARGRSLRELSLRSARSRFQMLRLQCDETSIPSGTWEHHCPESPGLPSAA